MSLTLAPVFGDHMVLQRDLPIRIFGWGKGSGAITFLGETRNITAGEKGWSVLFPALPAGGPYEMTLRLDGETRTLRDILIGEVWLAGGQSNMEALLKDMAADPGMEKDIPQVRCITLPHPTAPDLPEIWRPCTWEAAQDMTAVGYAFARCLHETLAVPVGIVSCNQGASRVESWTDPALLEEAGLRLPPEDTHEDEKVFAFNPPGYLYENMLLKVAPYGIRGVIWYQGESNRGCREADGYAARFLLMEQNWRRLWDNSRLPFLTVQLAPFGDVPHHGVETWPILREQQLAAADADPFTAMVTIGDVGDRTDIHPRRKWPVGLRLALAARTMVYGERLEYCGPVVREMRVEGGRAALRFDHADSGLRLDGPLTDLVLLDEEGAVYPGQARIREDGLLEVWNDRLPRPAEVRLGYANWYVMPLFNGDGLPASPFRIREAAKEADV